MPLDDFEWRPITFQGEAFPATLMGVSLLELVISIPDEELVEWLWRLPICRGVTNSAPADLCARCARKAADLMLEHRRVLLDGIREELGPYGFDADITYRDWILAFQRIENLSASAEGECVWSAPSHPDDKYKTPADWQRLADAVGRARARLDETTTG